MEHPSISVIMPVYNTDRFLAEAIESILNQTYRDFEFLIFDDGSTDKSKNIIAYYAQKDKRIVPFYSGVNSGYVDHLNRGVDNATAGFIARMDSDDIALADRLLLQLQFLKSHPDVAAVGSSSIQIDEQGKELAVDLRNSAPTVLLWQSFFSNPLAHPSVMFRKSAIVEAGLYDAERIPSEDFDLWTRVLRSSKLANVEIPLIKYRQHRCSISAVKSESQTEQFIISLKKHWRFFCNRDLSSDCAYFFRNFHKGYEPESLSVIRRSYFLLIRLYLLMVARHGLAREVEKDAFNKLLYLALRSSRFSRLTFIELAFFVGIVFPYRSMRKLLAR